MRKEIPILIIVFMLLSQTSSAFQDSQGKPDSVNMGHETQSIFFNPSTDPSFPGGTDSLIQFIHNQLKYPRKSQVLGIQGRITVVFNIQEMGRLTDFKILRSVPNGSELDKEAIRILSSSPLWNPGKINGRPRVTAYSVPIRFVTNDPYQHHYFVVDGERIKTDERKAIRTENIIEMDILTPQDAIGRFGRRAEVGAVIIKTIK